MRSLSELRRLAVASLLILAAGCSEPRQAPTTKAAPEAAAEPPPAVEAGPAPEATPAAAVPAVSEAAAAATTPAPAAPVQPREILGKKTQDVRDANAEMEKGGATVASTKITAKDPITLPGNAYVTIVGKTGMLNIQHALDLYNAENGRYPKDFAEFRDEVLKVGKSDGIALPVLPYYQEYGYDAAEHKLIILEYPDRKK